MRLSPLGLRADPLWHQPIFSHRECSVRRLERIESSQVEGEDMKRLVLAFLAVSALSLGAMTSSAAAVPAAQSCNGQLVSQVAQYFGGWRAAADQFFGEGPHAAQEGTASCAKSSATRAPMTSVPSGAALCADRSRRI